jgi:RNA polymerase sigma factor (sigma-70 family)
MSAAGLDIPGELTQLMPNLRAFLQRRAPQAEIDDLVQDVLLRVQNRQGGDIDNMEAYVYQVAHSTLVDHARRNQVRHREQHVELTEDDHPADELSPERVLSGEEETRQLLAALRELPERTRDALLLVRYHGASYKLVAKKFGISVSAVEKHVMKAMAHLTQRMKETQ